jgi:UDP-N-acetylmuramyl pentapeptide phosphotransferase/UDP-N-acetylglucosamine-1-phosphate transferase
MFWQNLMEVAIPHADVLGATVLAAFLISLILIGTRHWHGSLSLDHPGAIQTAHRVPTPRIGGIGIYLSLLFAWIVIPNGEARSMLGLIVLAGLPAWAFGLAEDLTKRVGVVPRLLATMFSGALACVLSGMALTRLDVPLLDHILTYWPVAVLFTAFAVGGVANSINIIDGFHGLASGTSILALLALAILSLLAGDQALAIVCLLTTGAVLGFWLVNYPWGKLFLGDGGAYFTGFALAWLAVLLPMRNPAVSPWASLMVCAYPFIEVVYSMLRRKLENKSMGDPDSAHLHSLLSSQLICKNFKSLSHTLQNAAVAPLVWIFVGVMVWLAIEFRHSTAALATLLVVAALTYHFAYRLLSKRSKSD